MMLAMRLDTAMYLPYLKLTDKLSQPNFSQKSPTFLKKNQTQRIGLQSGPEWSIQK